MLTASPTRRRLAVAACALGLFLGHWSTAAIAAALPWVADENNATLLARQGDTTAALAILQRLRHEYPDVLAISYDTIVVSIWAGHETEAVRLFAALPPGPRPNYVTEVVALAYRHLGQPAVALDLYRQALLQSPNNPVFTGGEIRSLAELGQPAAGIALAETDLRINGERPDILLAAGYAARAQKLPVEGLRYIDRALKRDPASHEARHDRIMAIDEMGAPQVAQQLANDSPGIVSADEIRQIDGDVAAALVRYGVFEPPSEALRFAASDRAIAALDALIAKWSGAGDAARHDLLRAQFDRMVALRDRVRMADVLAEYEDLVRHGVDVPGYALVAAADAYLYFHRPEQARDLYLRGLAVDPHNTETQLALFYAYVDLEDFDAAYREADTAATDQAIWIYLKGLNDPIPNPDRATADLAAADARLYADDLAEAFRRISAMAAAAPNDPLYLSALGTAESARGWPRLAAEEFDISRALRPLNVTTEVAQATNNLDLREYRLAETEAADLTRRFPENLEVQRLDRLLRVENMTEIRLTAEPTYSSPTNIQGGSGIAFDAEIYSPPIDYNWRVFAVEHVANEQLPQGAGTINLRRSGVGLEYRGPDMTASLEGTINAFGPKLDTTLVSGLGAGRGGVLGQATWSLNDYWSIGGSGELFALDTPLRALAAGITANAASANVVFRESESRSLTLTGEAMDFSDGNFRTSLNGEFTQRLFTVPHFAIDAIVGLAGSQNSADANRPYFNPHRDGLATVGVSFSQVIYRRYQFVYDHRLVLTPGVYWEQGYGAGGAASVLYEQRLKVNDVFEAGLGVTFSRQQYDGQYQSTVGVLLSLRMRF